jgi:hypothetical protein
MFPVQQINNRVVPVPGGYKYGDLTLQVGGRVSETFMCAVVTVIFRVYNSVSVITTALKSVAKKRLVKT